LWFQEISIPPLQRVIGNSEWGGLKRPKILKESMSPTWNFHRGGGVETPKNPLSGLGGYGCFLKQHIVVVPGEPNTVTIGTNIIAGVVFSNSYSPKLHGLSVITSCP